MDTIKPLPSRNAVRKHREERLVNGFVFPLNATSAGMDEIIHVRIRRVATIDRAVLQGLPTDLQDVLFAGIQEFQKEMAAAGNNPDPTNLMDMMSNNDKIVKAAGAWCKAAFIYPRLVDTEAEITDENTWLVSDVEPEDLVAVLMLSLDADSPQMRKLKMFRPQGGPASVHGGDMPVAETPVRVLEPVGTGVHGNGTDGV